MYFQFCSRLIAYDRNQNFGKAEQLEPEYKMSLPDPATYFDVNSDSTFSGTTQENMNSYLAQFDKEIDQQIRSLYNERTIRYFRISHDSDSTYVSSSCYAEYKKGLTYEIDILYDKNGTVIETQCECAAGEGPGAHCKHVCVVIYASVMFAKHKTIRIEETCTQILQSFHKCKRFLGSPLKSQNINMPGADEFTNIDFDPRPEHLRNDPGYMDYFRNTCLNFPGISEMPIFQVFEPANTHAIALDHDYFQLTPPDHFLENLGLLNITQEKIDAIEERTKGQANNVTWKVERTRRLTSSMFGRICKATDRTDRDKLARSLTTLTNVKAAPLEHGRRYENVAIKRFMEDSGNEVFPSGLVVSKDYPHIAASPDGIINKNLIVEVKCPYASRDKPVNTKTVPYIKIDDTGKYYLDENHNYFYQIQGQLLCTCAEKCILIVCHADNAKINDIMYIDVFRQDLFMMDMIDRLNNFYYTHFKSVLLDKLFYKPYHG